MVGAHFTAEKHWGLKKSQCVVASVTEMKMNGKVSIMIFLKENELQHQIVLFDNHKLYPFIKINLKLFLLNLSLCSLTIVMIYNRPHFYECQSDDGNQIRQINCFFHP